ncbi:uncharacterized protein NPIL_675351 [Nephila pilipes]|uniref:Uncharacterized protein n=1 Tax=Nephila pilipes TaxID=299642 RepID=A0A8X6TR59_NEPPI|nr:uncharacterized protein NPIL_675351 [Nephila pilipes]
MTEEMESGANETFAVQIARQVKTTTESYNFKYYPDDNETSVWMYAMISVGSAFVLFVIVTLYLMCHSAIRQVAEQDLMSRTTTSRGTGYRSYQSA